MTKKKTLQIIDEKFNALAGYRGAESCLGNVLAIVAGAKLNAGQVQEIREQLDGIKWRLVAIEDELRHHPNVTVTLVGPTPNEKVEKIQFYKRVVQPAMRKAARAKATK